MVGVCGFNDKRGFDLRAASECAKGGVMMGREEEMGIENDEHR